MLCYSRDENEEKARVEMDAMCLELLRFGCARYCGEAMCHTQLLQALDEALTVAVRGSAFVETRQSTLYRCEAEPWFLGVMQDPPIA